MLINFTEEKEAMRKTFLIGVLAALMLFAFTACEQNMPSTPLYGAQVENITVASQPVYILNGEGGIFPEIDASKITLNVSFNDGKTIQYTGEDLGMTVPTSYGANMSTPVTYNEKTYYVTLKAYDATSVGYDLSTIEAESFADGAFTTALTTTVASAGGSVTVETSWGLEADDIKKIVEDNDLKAGDTYTLTAEYVTALYVEKAEEAGATAEEIAEMREMVSFTGSKTLTYANPKTIMYITAEQGNKIYGVPDVTDKSTVKNSIAEAGIVVKAHLANGDEIVLSTSTGTDDETTSYGWTIKYIGYEPTYVFEEDNPGLAITVKAIAPSEGDYANQSFTTNSAHPFSLVISEDYPTVFKAEQKPLNEGEKAVKYYYNGEIIDDADFIFTPDGWASGYTDYKTAEDGAESTKLEAPDWTMTFTPDPARIPYGTATPAEGDNAEKGTDYDVVFNYVVDNTTKPVTVENVKVFTTAEIAAKAEAEQSN